MSVKLHPDGFILGGVCHRRLNDRLGREAGAWMAWADAQDQGCLVKQSRGRFRFVKAVKRRERGDHGGGNRENGYSRACEEIFGQLLEARRRFTSPMMARWLDAIAALEFGVAADSPLGPFTTGLIPGKVGDDVVYKKGHAKTYARTRVRLLSR